MTANFGHIRENSRDAVLNWEAFKKISSKIVGSIPATKAKADEIKFDTSCKGKLFCFRYGNARLAVPLELVEEITENKHVQAIPRNNSGIVQGLALYCGKLTPCLNLEEMLNLNTPANTNTHVLVLSKGNKTILIPIGKFDGIYSLGELQLGELSEHEQTTDEFNTDKGKLEVIRMELIDELLNKYGN